MSHVEKHKPDNRPPQELAKTILEHELLPDEMGVPAFTFSETLLQDAPVAKMPLADARMSGLIFDLHNALFIPGVEFREMSQTEKQNFARTALPVIAFYRNRYTKWRNDELEDAQLSHPTFDPDLSHTREATRAVHELSHQEGDGPSPEERERQAADSAGDYAVALSNLKQIEKLVRILAKKLGVELIEPGRRK